MSYINNNATYGSSSYGVNSLSNSFSNMGFQPAGGSSYSSIPVPPPLPQQSLYQGNSNNFLNGRNVYTREWNQASQYSSFPAQSYTTSSVIPTSTVVAAPVAGNMLPPPINDGRRYARLTGQKAGSRRSRRHLVQPLNGTGLQTLPAGVPVEGLAAAPLGNAVGLGGRRSGRSSRGLNTANNLNSSAGFPGTSNYISLGAVPAAYSGSALPLAASSSALPLQQQQFVSAPISSSFVSAPATTISAPLVSAPIIAAPVAGNMLPPPINDGRRYARLTGQKAGSRRSRRHLVQPLNGTGLQTLPAGVPVEGLGAASMIGNNGRRSRRMASRGLNNGSYVSSAPLATSGFAAPLASSVIAPVGTSALPQPHLAQIPLGAPKAGRGSRRNGRNGGLTRAVPLSAAPLMPVTTAPAFSSAAPYVSSGSLLSQPMIKQEFYAPIAQPSYVGGAAF